MVENTENLVKTLLHTYKSSLNSKQNKCKVAHTESRTLPIIHIQREILKEVEKTHKKKQKFNMIL